MVLAVLISGGFVGLLFVVLSVGGGGGTPATAAAIDTPASHLAVLRGTPTADPSGTALADLAQPGPEHRGIGAPRPMLPDLANARRVTLDDQEFWIAPTGDDRGVCFTAADGRVGTVGACASVASLGAGGEGVIASVRPAPDSDEPYRLVGLVPDDVTSVIAVYDGGAEETQAPRHNLVTFAGPKLPSEVRVVRASGETANTISTTKER